MAFDRFKRAMGQAFDTRSSERIRNATDVNETIEGMDFMENRGKKKKKLEPAQDELNESLKARRRQIYGLGIQGPPK
jgi:hypothetical protein